MSLTPEQFRRAEDLFHRASSLPADQRDAFVQAEAADDEAVAVEVASLLTHAQRLPSPAPLSQTIQKHLSASIADRQRTSGLSLVGQMIGCYEVQRLVGRGGMGVVYQARDTRLGRAVAIKALPPDFVATPARLARFAREAKLLASLSHPNIATVFDLEEHEGHNYLVMEWIEGKTLSQRLGRGPMPIEEALRTGQQIAAALEAAHEAGVIHRDLKPGNVILTRDGVAKVLDFGLARQTDAADGDAERPTAHLETREGAVMGTPGYMSPEQVRGRTVSRRTDIFSFGCVLYESLTGQMAFHGETGADIIAAVLEREPDWSRLPQRTPESVRRLMLRCTAKEPGLRLRDMGDARLELEEAIAQRGWLVDPATTKVVVSAAPRRGLAWAGWAVAGLLLAVLAIGAILWRPAAVPAPIHRFTLDYPGQAPQSSIARLQLALSPDGGRLAYVASEDNGPLRLWVHEMTQWTPEAAPQTSGAAAPVFSPDGQWLAYWLDGALMKRRVGGGDAQRLGDLNGWAGGDWGPDGSIVFVPTWSKPIARLSPQGERVEVITQVRFDAGELAHLHPVFTPRGDAVLYTAWYGHDRTQVHAVRLRDGAQRVVIDNGGYPHVAKTPLGPALLWVRRGSVFASLFDEAKLTAKGQERPVADDVLTDAVLFDAAYDVSDNGMFVYVPGPVYYEQTRLSWLDVRTPGAVPTPINDDRQPFAEPHLSGDGTKLSVVLKKEYYLGYVYDLQRGTFDRVSGEGDTSSSAISPDGTKVAYGSNRDGRYGLYLRDLTDGSERLLVPPERDYIAQVHWSPDSRSLVFCMSPGATLPRDMWRVRIDEAASVEPLWPSPEAEETNPRISPNGKWLAYASNETRTREVYVRSFPDGRIKRQISMGGGNWPQWGPDSDTLYFRKGAAILAAPLDPDTAAPRAAPAVAWEGNFGQSDNDMTDYTVAPDGRLLLVEPSEQGPQIGHMRVIVNWHELLRPAGR